jgi:hypothetical protein
MPICNSIGRILIGIAALFFIPTVINLTGLVVVEGLLSHFITALIIVVWLGWDAYQGTKDKYRSFRESN